MTTTQPAPMSDEELCEEILKVLVGHTLDVQFNDSKKFEALRNAESDEAAANALMQLIHQDREARAVEIDEDQIKTQLSRAYYNGLDKKGWSLYEEADAVEKIKQSVKGLEHGKQAE